MNILSDRSNTHQIIFQYPKRNSSSNLSHKIFWDKTTIQSVWAKLQFVKKKVENKAKGDYITIKNAICENQDSFVIEYLHNDEFKSFYRNKDDLYPDNVFQDIMINNLKFDLLLSVLKDPAYKFHNDYIFNYLSHYLSNERQKNENQYSAVGSLNMYNSNFVNSLYSLNYSLGYTQNDLEGEESAADYQNKVKKVLHNLIKNKLFPIKSEYKVKILGWFFAYLEYTEIFRDFINLPEIREYFQTEREQYNNFKRNSDISDYSQDSTHFSNVLILCMKTKLENLSILLFDLNHENVKNIGILAETAAETSCMDFLKFLWENTNIKIFSKFSIDKGQIKSNSKQKQPQFGFGISKNSSSKSINYDHYAYSYNMNKVTTHHFSPNFMIGAVIKKLTAGYTDTSKKPKHINTNLNKIISWKNMDKDKTVIDALFKFNCFEQISSIIFKWPAEMFIKADHFKTVILKKETELIIFFLQRRELRHVLTEHSIQEFIVNQYTPYGDKLYYAAEMLVYIYKNQWKSELTKVFCKNIMKALKTKDILNCHSPILTCLLLIEFLNHIKELSIMNTNICEKVMNELLEYCKNLQESNASEDYIAYLMKQKDTRNRSAFQIASENSLYYLLETPEIGTIIKKMWDGKLSYNSFYTASSLHRFIFDLDKKVHDPFNSFDLLDINKVYFFQLPVWLDSCLLRFFPVCFVAVLLVTIYNVFVYLLNSEGRLMNSFDELTPALQGLLRLYLTLVTCLLLDLVVKITFILKSKRSVGIGLWNVMDIFLFSFSWMILLDTRRLTAHYMSIPLQGSFHSFTWNIHLPFLKEFLTEYDRFSESFAFIVRVTILSIVDLLVWVRVCGILLVFKEMGPVIRMISSMAGLLVKYLIIIVIFIAWCATVFTVIFNRYSHQFIDFSTSIITLFGGFLNHFDVTDFEPKQRAFGSVLFMAYICVAGVLLINLLIAVLSNVYDKMAKVVDALYRSELIQYYKLYKWDNQYGYLMFLTPPFSIINYVTIIAEHLLFCGNDKKLFNEYVTRFYYIVFYYPFIMAAFMLYSLLLIPICLIKGFIIMIQYENSLKILRIFKIINCFRWIITGGFYLVYVYIRDIVQCVYYVFKEAEGKITDFQRIKRNLTNQDVIIFLKFLHSDHKNFDKKDIHSVFMAYLEYETSEKLLIDESLKKKKEYLSRLNEAAHQTSHINNKNNVLHHQNFFLHNKKDAANSSKTYTRYIKKNLMILEILENFIIDDDMYGSVIDIVKMRKLLPLTLNVQNFHLRRLVHSNMHALNHALTRLKLSKSHFLEYQLVNRIAQAAQRLDEEMDAEIMRIYRLDALTNQANEHKKLMNYKKMHMLKKPEDDAEDIQEHIMNKKEKMMLLKRYKSTTCDIANNIADIIIVKKSEGIVVRSIDKSDISSKKSEQKQTIADDKVKLSTNIQESLIVSNRIEKLDTRKYN